MLRNVDVRDVVRLLNQGVSEQSVKKSLLGLGATEDEAAYLIAEAARRASPPANGTASSALAPEYRHLAENAAQMLRDGQSSEYVAASARQLGFDPQQTRDLLALAQKIAARQAKRWWQFWK